MEQIINEIKYAFDKKGSISQIEVEKFLKLFREKGISSMTLEELLNFYAKKEVHSDVVEEEAFVNPTEALHTSYDDISQKYKELQYKNKQTIEYNERLKKTLAKTEKRCKILIVCIVLLLIMLVGSLIITK